MIRLIGSFALFVAMPVSMFASARLTAADSTVGQSLATNANLTLSEAAPAGGLQITVTSGNPSLMLLANRPEAAGSASIVVRVEAGRQRTPDFYVYGLENSGTATYTASAPGYDKCTATVRLAASGIVIKGSYALGNPMLLTTGSAAAKISLYSGRIGPSGEFVEPQPVAGGRSVTVNLTSSNEQVGTISPSAVVLAGGSNTAAATFQAVGAGKTTLAAHASHGLDVSSKYGMVAVTVIMPGIGITDQVAIGRDLQIHGTLTLGQPAPPEGLHVTLISNNPKQLLLSHSAEVIGAESITIDISSGGANGTFYLQALSDNGNASYTASAPGYANRTATVHLTPSGVVMGIQPPDEADLFRKEAAEEEHGISVNLARNPSFALSVYMVQLHPVNLRGADITVQPLRAGVSTTVAITSSNPSIATLGSEVRIRGGFASASIPFTAQKEGTTIISAATPAGFTTAKNATSLTVIVKP